MSASTRSVEARRPAAWVRVDLAAARALLGLAAAALLPLAVLLERLAERRFEIGQGLAHPHGAAKETIVYVT